MTSEAAATGVAGHSARPAVQPAARTACSA